MTTNESSPLFHDANQYSPPGQQLSISPTDSVLNETPNESTPIGQRRLFTGPNDDDDEDTNNDGRSEIHRLYTQSQELDLGLVHKDDEDDGDCGSNCDAAELEDLNNDISNMEKST